MKTNKAEATNNMIVRVWSRTHYKVPTKPKHEYNIYNGTLTSVDNKEVIHFHTPTEFMRAVEKMNSDAEKTRNRKWKKQTTKLK